MKPLYTTILTLFTGLSAYPQNYSNHRLLQSKNQSQLYYVDIENNEAKVYPTIRSIDVKKGVLMTTDTLQQQADGSFTGRRFRIMHENNELFLVNLLGKIQKHRLDSVTEPKVAYNKLNRAYYLNHYSAMSERLNNAFPLNHINFREAYYTWETIPTELKEMEYRQFRTFTDNRLKEIEDSSSTVHDKYTRVTNHIIENIRQLDYTALKDSIAQLPVVYPNESKYYGNVINALVVSQPEYFLRLAEDQPENQSLMFFYATDNKQARASIDSVTGHEKIRKAFIKEQRSKKLFPYTSVGIAALGAGLLVYVILIL
ncbi:hypothetical protein DVR12_14530 [Chitinophaga silvatica]|uniref:Uncharacterized protein n=1 Tax=Chitinophaga silvatica TaxID=2282649 RepID=A0A3E1Y8Y4_9BACT|nr:hypothetical protein [Chitinophaga silvatica]RFS21865.1 hypothetical protein DVR12_14530 [Chitinophaga silvatica]